MRIAVIGRTKMLLDAARCLRKKGHELVLIATAKPSPEDSVSERDYRELAEESGCEFVQGVPRDTKIFCNALMNARADIGITMNWPAMLGPDVVAAIPRGIVNAHGSDLPKYRGNACPNWAILEGESEVGLTLHMVDPHGLDTGPIVAKRFLSLNESTYICDIYEWLFKAVPDAFVNAIELISSPEFVPQCQSADGACRAYPRRVEDGRIVWGEEARHVHRLVRASGSPFSGAFCYYENEERVIVRRAEVLEWNLRILAVPGQIMEFQGEFPVVACGKGTVLRLTDFETESGRMLPRSVRARFT